LGKSNILFYKKINTPFAVVCHDAGGASQIAAMLRVLGHKPKWVFAVGPALKIFQRELPNIEVQSELSGFKNISAIITGSGWGSNIEHQARQEAKQAGVRSITVLDHWANYKERFKRNGDTVLPDELWVVDIFAEALARSSFPDVSVVRVTDFLTELELKRIDSISESTPSRLLYLLEPVRSDWGQSEPGEFQALRYFLEKWSFLKFPVATEIKLRLHPSEDREKYAAFIDKNRQLPVSYSAGTLSEDISAARWVAGCQTYAMTLALAAGRPVYSTLPPWAPPKVLPHPGIQYLREMAFA